MKNSSIEFLEHQDFNFDLGFDLGHSISTEFHSCPADDLFYDGHLLPLTKSNAVQFSSSESSSFGENRILISEKLQTWRSDSLDSRSSYWTISSSNNSQASRGNFNYSASQRKNSGHVNSESKPRRSSSTSPKPRHWCTEKSLKWQQFFAVGLSKTPVMQLDDMRLRQQKSLKNRHIEQSVNGKMAGETPRAKDWIKMVTLTSLNGCMGSVKSVIHCTTVKKPINGRDLSH
ncbi:uncharacterized protein LOC131059601 [Cryptomeria japonica]|uniref:uncharacterized protein LOC131059601 n=1 Tax=Cryptomeria japonica TaxID=3369 RepID=UPI0027DA1B90|nr:uncharacterized protein LOC131059601 [Cryptomeria japonica]